jgi:nucleoside-diphosphate-sugar epimerase
MRVLVIGASGFIGPHVVTQLLQRGCDVAALSHATSQASLPQGITRISGDRNRIAEVRDDIAQFNPDVVVDIILSSGRQATELMARMCGIAKRVVAISSADVYRACGILHGFETGSLQQVPLTEDSELRTKREVYPPQLIQQLKQIFGWVDDEYDKIQVEETVLGDPSLPGTVLRLPMVYGPGDRLHRFRPYLKRMDDRRPAILLQEDAARWHAPRGYVENVAAAITLATLDGRATGRIYNVAEQPAFSEEEWANKIAAVVGWSGKIVKLPKEKLPVHLQVTYRSEQDWVVSSERIRRELGYTEPVAERTALERTIAWERANPSEVFRQVFDYPAEDQALATVASA